jgi:SAM-dependent methyltransferase
VDESPQTWHYGVMARWWAESTAQADELAYYAGAIERFGQPALDLGAGAGRILLPLLERGFDVDGVDISADMLEQAQRLGSERGLSPALQAQAFHQLDLARRYRTIYSVDSFGIGGSRAQDREALRRVYDHLEPGGAFVFSIDMPWAGVDADGWARWLPSRRAEGPADWPAEGSRRSTSDGDELELLIRAVGFDPLLQRRTIEMKARLWREGRVVEEDQLTLRENLYFPQELLLMLDAAGFRDAVMEGRYNGLPATADDETLVFVAKR